ncbi:MAG: hypothetical protein CBD76_00420 [Pelagibacteraceae bacterium TMED216]|nr:MAG: hypothetical protein CBD76_00420 [Pelagibacteraceae bacterium TMED216]
MFKTSEKSLTGIINNYLSIFYFLNLLLVMVFMRSFVGIYIFGFQVGKIYTGISLIICLLLTIRPFTSQLLEPELNKLINVIKLILFSFLIVLIINKSFNFNTDILRNSSYLWSLGYFFLGFYFLKRVDKRILLTFVSLGLFASYFITFINYPNFIMDFFIKYSDKFQFIKAADMLLIVIVFNFLVKKYKFSKQTEFLTFIATLSIFTPYFFVQSRGSVLGAFVYFILNLFSFFDYLKENKIKSIIILITGGLIFYGSSYFLSGIAFNPEYSAESIEEVNTIIVEEVVTKKNVSKGFLTFYFADGRIHSYDNTTNWRLDIWQDLIQDLYEKRKLVFGFGYEEIFEIMLDPTAPGRLGRDGLNENVHNYFMNILGRGGVVQLILFLYFYFVLFKIWRNKGNSLNSFLTYMIPILIVSSLDVTMEGVQFPLLFFSFIGHYVSYD